MSAIAVYTPPSTAVAAERVFEVCDEVEAWAASEGVAIDALCDTKAKLSAVDAYLAQRDQPGRARVAATLRFLERRIGEELGEATRNHDRRAGAKSSATDIGLSKNDRREFREMAAHPEVVEHVVAESSDQSPASRRKVLAAIKEAKSVDPMGEVPAVGRDQSRHAVDARVAQSREMAARGATSRQIAKAIGIRPDSMADFRKRHGIEVPADAVVGRTRILDSSRVVRAMVENASGIGVGSLLDTVDWSAIDLDEARSWVPALNESIAALMSLRNRLKELLK